MKTHRDPIAELMTRRAEDVSRQIYALLHGLGHVTQAAILADLVSLWLAGQFVVEELGNAPSDRPLTAIHREQMLLDWLELVRRLVPESEQQIMRNVEPEGRA